MFQNLGTGVGLRPAFYEEFKDQHPASVAWVEVITENFIRWENGLLPRLPISNLEAFRKEVPVVLHGVSMSIGSADPVNYSYLSRLKELISRIEPSQVSDHLCWTGLNKQNLHDLLPLPYTQEAVDHVVAKIKIVQDYLGRQILIENLSSYIEFNCSEMTEWEFLSEVTSKADCGILLDLNNVYVSSVNHSFDPKTYLQNIPSQRVAQIHLAGHAKKDGCLIDTHDEPVCNEVWELFEYYTHAYGTRSTMIERDGKIPEWKILEAEVLKAKRIAEGESYVRRTASVTSATI